MRRELNPLPSFKNILTRNEPIIKLNVYFSSSIGLGTEDVEGHFTYL